MTYAVGDDVRVSVEAPLGVSVRGLVAGEVPDDQRLVAGSGQEHVRAGENSQRNWFRQFDNSPRISAFVLEIRTSRAR